MNTPMMKQLAVCTLLCLAVSALAQDGPLANNPKLTLIKGGFKKLDTPQWLPDAQQLLVTDLELNKTWTVDDAGKFTEVLDKAFRCTLGPDGRCYGSLDGNLVSWKLGEQPKTLVAKKNDQEVSLNDIVVTKAGYLYFSTLKDPDFGRLSVVSLKDQSVRVLFDGAQEDKFWNPNGVAVSPDEKHLYVVISSYKDRKRSAIYRFAMQADGGIDFAEGKKAPWSKIAAADGLCTDVKGNVYVTQGPQVWVLDPQANKLGSIAIPSKESGCNQCFGGPDRRTLYVTTFKALFKGPVSVEGTLP